jgi:hypothetical protein
MNASLQHRIALIITILRGMVLILHTYCILAEIKKNKQN